MAPDLDGTNWRAVADGLASALRQALLRNPTLPARAWDEGVLALGRYDAAVGDGAALPAGSSPPGP